MKIGMSRDITNKVHWILDNLLPPVMRESKFLMGILAWGIYGKYGKYYLNFKENGKYLTMSDEDFKHYYEMIAPIITRPTDINNACMKKLLEESEKWGDGKVLDISCGRGFLSKELAKHNGRLSIVGSDINIPKELLDCQTDRLTFVNGNIEHLDFEDKSFDVVISTHTLEHVVNAKQAYDELKRVCKKKLIIIVPCQRQYKYTMDFHVQFFPYEFSLLQFTGNYGATCVKIDGDLWYEEMIED
ncbi:MAG: class I SAM-dependent methyltransferase [Treponema sp.]|nr:class I SAM-dependent methyltransferase [Treponema sp.]MCR5621994.1 class I SAM-dependent methyltransferase [Treponema sp.]